MPDPTLYRVLLDHATFKPAQYLNGQIGELLHEHSRLATDKLRALVTEGLRTAYTAGLRDGFAQGVAAAEVQAKSEAES